MTDPANTKPWPAMSIAHAHALLTGPGSPLETAEIEIRGIKTRVWKNLYPTLRELLLLARAQYGPREFLVYHDERATYDGLYRAAVAIAHQLQQQGVKKGDRVALVMRNLPEWPAIFYGAGIIGAIVAPLNAWWTWPELEFGLLDCGATVLFMDGEHYARIAEHLGCCVDIRCIYVSRHPEALSSPLVARLEDIIGPVNRWHELPDQPLPDAQLEADDDATILYTSGTTGKPKGALGTHRNMLSNVFASACSTARNFLRRGEMPAIPSPADPQRSGLVSIPFFHTTGCFAIINPSIASGGKLVLMHKWDVELAMQLIERERINGAGGVPAIAWQLIEHPNRRNYDLSSIDSINYGGAPSAPELVRKIREVFPKALPGNGWGMTETSATCTHHSAEDYERRPDSCGPAVPVCDLKIMSLDGAHDMPVGEVGELWARGPNIVRGYWNNPKATAETFIDGWLRTGDLARLDEEGFCYIVDRAKDMLIRGGENIYCIEVENALYQHPAVMDAAVVSIPHHTLGEESGAVVHLKPGTHATEEGLRAFAAERLAGFKVPVRIVFWPETLPRNANGKIVKSKLKKIFAVAAVGVDPDS
ncbi:MAG: class I adenylate-forming enzyme family protein [Alphaproteobacteria bacterium]